MGRSDSPFKHVICVWSFSLIVVKKTRTEGSNDRTPISRPQSHKSSWWIHLDALERIVRHLDLEDRSSVVVDDVPDLHDAVLPGGEEDRHPHGAPAPSSQTRGGWLHPHDWRWFNVLAPNFRRVVSDSKTKLSSNYWLLLLTLPNDQKVFRIETVPVDSQDSALLEIIIDPKYHVAAPLLGWHPTSKNFASSCSNQKLWQQGK